MTSPLRLGLLSTAKINELVLAGAPEDVYRSAETGVAVTI